MSKTLINGSVFRKLGPYKKHRLLYQKWPCNPTLLCTVTTFFMMWMLHHTILPFANKSIFLIAFLDTFCKETTPGYLLHFSPELLVFRHPFRNVSFHCIFLVSNSFLILQIALRKPYAMVLKNESALQNSYKLNTSKCTTLLFGCPVTECPDAMGFCEVQHAPI